MPSKTLQAGASGGAASVELSRFCANMTEGLHAMAQPLTILRSAIAACRAPGATESSQRRYLDLSSQQVERTCSLFECLQDLVIASQATAEQQAFDLPGLLTAVIQDRKTELESSGIELKVEMPDSLPFVQGDASRTLQAVLAALKTAISVSSLGDVIELGASAREGFIEMVVQNGRTHTKTLDSSKHLSLALAEANIRSQHGEYKWSEDPFCVSLTLPLAGRDP